MEHQHPAGAGAAPQRQGRFAAMFGSRKPLIGNLHLPALPGAPRYDGRPVEEIYDFAVADALRLRDGGIDAIMIENAGDLPYRRPEDIGPETVAFLAVATDRVRQATGLPVGITCVANGVIPALAVAKAAGAGFVRANIWITSYVANEGILDGPAAEATRYASAIDADDVLVLADVKVKFGAHVLTQDRPLAEVAQDIELCGADAVVVTGLRTGSATSVDDVREVKDAVGIAVVVGSGLSPQNSRELFEVADGAVVGASLKHDGNWWNAVDPDRLGTLIGGLRG